MSQSKTSIVWLGLLSAFSLITFDLYQPSLPYITTYFETTPPISQLTLSIYLLFFGVTQLVWGPLIDHYGRRCLLPGSLFLAFVGSLICVFSLNIYVLILGRSLQGIALCCSNVIALSTSRDFEDPVLRAKVLSYISMIVSVSPIFAPVLGSLLFTSFGWQYNFLLMAAIALILLIQSKKALFESPFWNPPKKAFKINNIVNDYRSISKKPALWYGSFVMMFSFAAVMLTVINSSYLIIDVLQFSPLGFGIIFILNGLNIIVGNYLGILLRKYFNMTTTIYLGNGLIIIGGLMMLVTMSWFGFNLIALSFALITNLGISVSAPSTMSLTLSDFKENSGLATAFVSTVRILGSSLLTILVGYLLTQNLNALPIGLIACGIGALYCSWQFKRVSVLDMEPTFLSIEQSEP